jgi:outer membrane protein OmpA-like peptidoglycan-associated protein
MSDSHQDDQALSHSMTDLMTSLAIIFILLLVIYLNHTYQETQQGSLKRLEALKTELDKALIDQSIECEMDAKKDPLSCTIRVRDDKLQFAFNSAALAPRGQSFLHWMTPRLTGILCGQKFRNDIEAVFIQGFTDSVGDDNTNLKLSAERSFQVLSYSLNKTGLHKEHLNCLLDLASTSGRGERELRVNAQGKEISTASRRVEFKIRVKSYELRKQVERELPIRKASL